MVSPRAFQQPKKIFQKVDTGIILTFVKSDTIGRVSDFGKIGFDQLRPPERIQHCLKISKNIFPRLPQFATPFFGFIHVYYQIPSLRWHKDLNSVNHDFGVSRLLLQKPKPVIYRIEYSLPIRVPEQQ